MSEGVLVNDVHSELNPVMVAKIIPVDGVEAVRAAVAEARATGGAISIAGSRHAMGAQQFGTGTILLDMRGMDRVLGLDRDRGLVEVEAGIQWPALIEGLAALQPDEAEPWVIRQKQTGADELTLGGALAANVHGRGLQMQPMIADVESFTLVDAQGEVQHCSRRENVQLFRTAIGGYGLFGVICTVVLRLTRRCKVRRDVELVDGVDAALALLAERTRQGYLYGDFQFDVDDRSPEFLRRGVCACYAPVAVDTPMPAQQRELSADEWAQLAYLAHADKARAYQLYARHYAATSGQIYWSDTHQLGYYLPGYHRQVEGATHAAVRGSEVISELYVPRAELAAFMEGAAALLRQTGSSVIYGTVRLIERDDESVLAWARQAYACVIFNLHVDHDPAGLDQAERSFRGLIDLALEVGGSFYLTYHKFATRSQVERAYPQFREFLAHKAAADPEGVFESDWYRHLRGLLAGGAGG
jgi:FAD/FMN-containing dehydrogenase